MILLICHGFKQFGGTRRVDMCAVQAPIFIINITCIMITNIIRLNIIIVLLLLLLLSSLLLLLLLL